LTLNLPNTEANGRIFCRQTNTTSTCKGIRHGSSSYCAHFLFEVAFDEINRNFNILPNITLGFHIYDSCSDGPKAVKSILQILSGPGKTVPNYHCRGRGQIVGFIGDHSSVTTLPMAQILGVYKYTQISYGATHDVLNDRSLYPTFFRTLQSDSTSYSVLLKLLKHFGWTWVGILASNDDSGEKETLVLTKHMTSNGICVAFTIKINLVLLRDTDRVLESYRNIVKESSANIIVICGTFSPYVANFFKETEDIFADRTLILNPTFAVNNFLLEFYPKTFNGSLALEHFPIEMPDMMTFFESFHPLDHPDDCFLKHIWLLHFRCDVGDQRWNILKDIYKISLHNCTGKERLKDFTNFAPDGLSPRVYSAVHAMIEGLQQIHLFLNRKKNVKSIPLFNYKKQHSDNLCENSKMTTRKTTMEKKKENKSVYPAEKRMSVFFLTPSKDTQEHKSENEVNTSNTNMDPSMAQESSLVPETTKDNLQDQLKLLLEAQFNMLKQDMLKSLEDIKQDTNRIAISVQALEKKLVSFDNQLGTVKETVQSLINKTSTLEQKIAALEDRSRQFNLRL
ncbi:vomeronasal type-2 receptor 26-like, partial [Pelobates cultripes]